MEIKSHISRKGSHRCEVAREIKTEDFLHIESLYVIKFGFFRLVSALISDFILFLDCKIFVFNIFCGKNIYRFHKIW